MCKVLRRFTLDTKNFYFAHRGILMSKPVLDLINEHDNIYYGLDEIPPCAGWCSYSNGLMITEDDLMFRVNADTIISMMTDPDVKTYPSYQKDIYLLEYDSCKYRSEDIIVDEDYRRFDCTIHKPDIMCSAPMKRISPMWIECLLVSDRYSIYELDEEGIRRWHILDYIAYHGVVWRDKLSMRNDRIGFILNGENVNLRILHDMIDQVSEDKVSDMLKDANTRMVVDSTGMSDYLSVTYDNLMFPDVELQATVDYKKTICERG